MDKRRKIQKWLFSAVWVVGLGAITLVLLTTGGTGFEHYVKLGAVSILWFIFLVYLFDLHAVANLQALPKRFDRLILLCLVLVFFLLILGAFFGALAHLRVVPALLFGLFGWGIWNVIRDLVAGNGKKRP